jgi:hypothetical protein
MIKDYEFYGMYANLHLQKRGEYFGFPFRDIEGQYLTPHMIYEEIKTIDDKIRDDIIRKEKLLAIADRYFNHV